MHVKNIYHRRLLTRQKKHNLRDVSLLKYKTFCVRLHVAGTDGKGETSVTGRKAVRVVKSCLVALCKGRTCDPLLASI